MLHQGGARTWKTHGRIVSPDPAVSWMTTCAGSAGTIAHWDEPEGVVYVSGRDEKNRSIIGQVTVDVRDKPTVTNVAQEPAFRFGTLGSFDENGVSYPSLVSHEGKLLLYYAGWMPSVLTPFQNHIGLAVQQGGSAFERVSRAPILPRTDTDHLWLGSMYVMHDGNKFRMWYTACLEWTPTDDTPLHRYLIKYAESNDGVAWVRDDVTAIDFASAEEFAIARPSVLHVDGHYHMWFCSRGEEYRLGYAHSEDGVHWERRDDALGFSASGESWDGSAQCYPCVFQHGERLFMLYNGNGYGREGLGIAELAL